MQFIGVHHAYTQTGNNKHDCDIRDNYRIDHGAIAGAAISNPKIGCLILLIIPAVMIFYISWWRDGNPDKLTSTSALDFFVAAFWPSFGAICGFFLTRRLRAFLRDR